MCEYRQTDSTERILYRQSPLSIGAPKTYYKSLNSRAAAWISLVTGLNKNKFEDMVIPLKLTEDEKQQLWILIAYTHYNLISPTIFFDFLMEMAIEEKARFTSFATAEKLRKWPTNPIPARFQDNFLVFLYIAIRDGEYAFSLLKSLDSL